MYDIPFIYKNINYLLEYDGGQHFKRVHFFCKTEEKFQYYRNIDIEKTYLALSRGFRIIRIDHTKINCIQTWIEYALDADVQAFYSDNVLYSWIIEGVKEKIKIAEEDDSKNEDVEDPEDSDEEDSE